MACNGHTGVCNTYAGRIGPGTASSWTDDPVDTNDLVKNTHYNQMRTAIKAEIVRRSMTEETSYSDPGAQSDGDIIYSNDYRYVRNNIRKAGSWTWYPSTVNNTTGIAPGLEIQDDTTNDMRDETNDLETECLCECNYSCTCNCNYCTCNCAHTCTCNCAYYSDEKLKKDIGYL